MRPVPPAPGLPPPPGARPPGVVGGPGPYPREPVIITTGPRMAPKRRGNRSDSSDSDSATSWSSDSSVGAVRRKLRRYRAKKERVARGPMKGGRRYYTDSESESEDEGGEDIKVEVGLKRGDDVVRKLLDLWTPAVKGKGKA
jgi:hypothetical protein